ncbi:unnamed protein product [Ilex paraguariensis]|uniref:Uncharacterized protein n=1 Tax=Ilex paraguariensis TaxID=185542 RepID=A0ABC8TFM5_9AQUA
MRQKCDVPSLAPFHTLPLHPRDATLPDILNVNKNLGEFRKLEDMFVDLSSNVNGKDDLKARRRGSAQGGGE